MGRVPLDLILSCLRQLNPNPIAPKFHPIIFLAHPLNAGEFAMNARHALSPR
jgi:hypothetical protein